MSSPTTGVPWSKGRTADWERMCSSPGKENVACSPNSADSQNPTYPAPAAPPHWQTTQEQWLDLTLPVHVSSAAPSATHFASQTACSSATDSAALVPALLLPEQPHIWQTVAHGCGAPPQQAVAGGPAGGSSSGEDEGGSCDAAVAVARGLARVMALQAERARLARALGEAEAEQAALADAHAGALARLEGTLRENAALRAAAAAHAREAGALRDAHADLRVQLDRQADAAAAQQRVHTACTLPR